MPRPYPPPPAHVSIPLPFTMSSAERRDIAQSLGLHGLPPRIEDAINAAISAYKATAAGSRDTTVGNTLAALSEIQKKGRAYMKAVARVADVRSGVDYITHHGLHVLAEAVLEKKPGAAEALDQAVEARIATLRNHKRVDTRTESLRFFCGCLRVIFNDATDHLRGKITVEEAWRRCRNFAMRIFAIADVDHNFIAHPERLTEYLGTDVTDS